MDREIEKAKVFSNIDKILQTNCKLTIQDFRDEVAPEMLMDLNLEELNKEITGGTRYFEPKSTFSRFS